jgi:hypothetical protein
MQPRHTWIGSVADEKEHKQMNQILCQVPDHNLTSDAASIMAWSRQHVLELALQVRRRPKVPIPPESAAQCKIKYSDSNRQIHTPARSDRSKVDRHLIGQLSKRERVFKRFFAARRIKAQVKQEPLLANATQYALSSLPVSPLLQQINILQNSPSISPVTCVRGRLVVASAYASRIVKAGNKVEDVDELLLCLEVIVAFWTIVCFILPFALPLLHYLFIYLFTSRLF